MNAMRSWMESTVVVREIVDVRPEHVTLGHGPRGDGATVWATSLAERFREAVVQTTDPMWRGALAQTVSLYSDGGVLRPRACEAGSWAWVAVDAHDRMVAYQRGWIAADRGVPGWVTNNQTEYVAMLRALEEITKVVPGWSGRMYSDSQITLGRFEHGWRLTNIPRSWQIRLSALQERLGTVEYVACKGHPTAEQRAAGEAVKRGVRLVVSPYQEFCDTLCARTIAEWKTANEEALR